MEKNGFSLTELIVTIGIMGIIAGIAIPGFSYWIPRYRLRSAATDLYSNIQLAKMGAIKDDSSWAILFDPGSNRYAVCSDDGGDGVWSNGCTEEKSVDLDDYGSGVSFGHGNASSAIGSSFGDEITYGFNVAVFNSRGTGNAGYVYFENDRNTLTFGVGTRSSGVVRLLKWNESGSTWE